MKKIKKIAIKAAGRRYNPQILDAVIEAGIVPTGAYLASTSDSTEILRYIDGEIFYFEGGQVSKKVTVITTAQKKYVLALYAASQSQLGLSASLKIKKGWLDSPPFP